MFQLYVIRSYANEIWNIFKRTSLFARAFPPRGLTMHVSDPLALARRIGRGTFPCHVSNDCLAAAGKTRHRAPFGGFSRATPVPLRHRTAWACPESVSLRLPPMSTSRHPSLAWRSRDHHPRTPFGPPMPHRHAPAFFSREENHSLHGPLHGALRRLSMPSTGSTPPASPCGVAEGRTRGIVPQDKRIGKTM